MVYSCCRDSCPVSEPVHGVGGDALGGVDGGGVAETGGVLDVVGGQPDSAAGCGCAGL